MKIVKVLVLSIIVGFSFSDCKKGDKDPFLSLSSRKARLSGEWELTGAEFNYRTKDGSDSSVSTGKLEGNVYTVIETYVEDGETTTYTNLDVISDELTIKRDGTFNHIFKVLDAEAILTNSGNWIFLGKNEGADLKNKEAILFSNTEETNESPNGDGSLYTSTDITGEVWEIVQLKGKELIFKISFTRIDDDGYSEESVLYRTYTKKK